MSGPGLVNLFWVLGSVATIVIALRIFAKVRIGHLKVDDVVMIFAWTLAIVASSLFTIAVHYGYGQDLGVLRSENAVQAIKYYIITQACVICSTAAGRVAFILYLLAILGGEKKHRIILPTLAILEVIFNAVSIILIFSSCKNVQMIWNKAIHSECGPLDRQIRYSYFQSAFNTAVDLYLVTVPMWIFWNLNLQRRTKASLLMLMSLGLMAMLASLVKTVALRDIASPNVTGATASLIRWGLIENYIVIITASLPCLRSLVVSVIHHMSATGPSFPSWFTIGGSRTQGNRMTNWYGSLSTRINDPDGLTFDHILPSCNPVDRTEMVGTEMVKFPRTAESRLKAVV